MDLQLTNHLIVVGGATSGFGRAIAEALIQEGATVIGIARNAAHLNELAAKYSNKFEALVCDITHPESVKQIVSAVGGRSLYGVLVNAAGPPAKTVMETTMADWDDAYQRILRWKIDLTRQLLPLMLKNKLGRFLFVESASVKQPMENLVLSNSFRIAVVGFVKTISQEVSGSGITFNVLAPGSHETAANERVVKKKMEQSNASREEVIDEIKGNTTVGRMGNANDFASLACWLFSPYSGYLNGQTISVDGGSVRGIMG